MKLLLFSDLHDNRQQAERLVAESATADLVIGAGDFGNPRRGISRCVDWLSGMEKPAVLVPGNSESFEELGDACREAWPSATVLHGSGAVIEGISFFGIGGGIPVTPFGAWSYDFTEDEARNLLAACSDRVDVLVTHSPPRGVLDVSSRGLSLGSVAIREFLDSREPALVVCGHIHESSGKSEEIGGTTVVNAGPAGMRCEI